MPRKPKPPVSIEPGTDLGQRIMNAQIFSAVSYQQIDEALSQSSRRENRRMGKFSDHLVVHYVILMCLHMDLSYGKVFERLEELLRWLSLEDVGEIVNDSTISRARQRVGFQPLEHLFRTIAKPLSQTSDRAAFLAGYRITLLDGTVIDVPDTPENAIFGRKTANNLPGPFPQVRAVTLVEYNSRAIFDVELAGIVGSDEITLAKPMLARLPFKSVVIADRFYPGTPLCRLILERESHFIIRVKDCFKLTPIERFSDGSYLAHLCQSDENPLVVRVIDYTLRGSNEAFRLVTSFLDPKTVSAKVLANHYHDRWTIETVNDELKASLTSQVDVLRSKSPCMVIQEIYGLILAHYIVRSFMDEAARHSGVQPKEISYANTVEIIIREAPKLGAFPPSRKRPRSS